jgi:beta-glucosidase
VSVEYRPGCQLTQTTSNPLDWSVYTAGGSDITIACMGISPLMEGEEGDATLSTEQGDRAEIALPAVQAEYIKKLVVQGAKVVLVLFGGSPIALGEIENMVQAVVYVWYPGQEGGRAVADILFGKVNPSGKLPLTFPKGLHQLPPFEDYDMVSGMGRTYRYSTEEPLYPFGFGLSYTHFEYSDLVLTNTTISAANTLDFAVTVHNRGAVDGEEVVQAYIHPPHTGSPAPRQALKAFQRVALKAGQSQTVHFSLPAQRLMGVNSSGSRVLTPGEYRLSVGGSSPSERSLNLGAAQPVQGAFQVK